jgi:hypothetical protein
MPNLGTEMLKLLAWVAVAVLLGSIIGSTARGEEMPKQAWRLVEYARVDTLTHRDELLHVSVRDSCGTERMYVCMAIFETDTHYKLLYPSNTIFLRRSPIVYLGIKHVKNFRMED